MSALGMCKQRMEDRPEQPTLTPNPCVTRGWKTVQSSPPLTPNLLLEFEVFEVNNELAGPDKMKTKLLRATRN